MSLYPTWFSMLSWLPVCALGLSSDPSRSVAYAFFLLLLVTLIWHFVGIRHWRLFTRSQRFIWCAWSFAVVGLLLVMLTPTF